MKKILLIFIFSVVSLFSYNVEKNGDRYYIYEQSKLIGTYTKSWNGKYRSSCGSPKVPTDETKYKPKSSCYNKIGKAKFTTKIEAKNAVINCCVRR